MTEEQLKPIIQNYIDQALLGSEKENPKLDFKAKWYNLKEDIEINEFIKDTSAIANTPGLDGYIIIGFDEKNKELHNSHLTDSGLKDTNELVGIINKRVDRSYQVVLYNLEINTYTLSVLYIPPSFDKPHVIRLYKSKSGKEEHHRVWSCYICMDTKLRSN